MGVGDLIQQDEERRARWQLIQEILESRRGKRRDVDGYPLMHRPGQQQIQLLPFHSLEARRVHPVPAELFQGGTLPAVGFFRQ